jgi:alkanesulfonate monooxygenase SsuD/methylene tetrahydromethanopterin reductase-like flavin-dependent oxidoreductase (luciferase family)
VSDIPAAPALRFGTFITPLNGPPEYAVERAVLSEQLGFDLVTFQDHPYQPRFHDTWTLMTWVAARTSRIQVSANVHNVPLRPPAVLARAAASLDLLSGGRVALALGAGGFWDAIAAMGGERRTPGESVEALSEAVDVIRSLWEVGDRSPLRVPGRFYRLDGAKRGPAPAHPIPIWIGAQGPRMQRLIARKADGWVSSLGYVGLEGVRAGNAIIDAAAAEAGRAPTSIRRIVNVGGRFAPERGGYLDGPVAQWVEELTALVVDDRVDTVILASDDADVLRRFAHEVLPAVREGATVAAR